MHAHRHRDGQARRAARRHRPRHPAARRVPHLLYRALILRHGIGRSFHEEPQVLLYGRPGNGGALETGMTFTIEPMVNAGKRQVKLLPDNWTVVTKDHSLSAQWEHTILVTADGFEVLTKCPDDDI